jgi:uncharacterized membrane protein YgcG
MQRRARALPSALALLVFTAGHALAAGPPFPAPEPNRAVYDEAGILSSATITDAEERIDAVEAETGVEIVVYTQVDPEVSEAENLTKAAALMDQWGVGRAGFDDGLVLLVGMQPNLVNGRVSLYGGSGFVRAHIDEDGLADLISDTFVPRARDGDFDAAVLNTIERIQERVAPGTVPLTVARVFDAILGLVLAPIALLASAAFAFLAWRRRGRDPRLVDSPSILMAGPPADMTPSLATIIVDGKARQHTVNTALVELAGGRRITFQNLDQVGKVKSDDKPNPLTDPAILVEEVPPDARALGEPEARFYDELRRKAGTNGRLTRRSLWSLNSGPGATLRRRLEQQAVKMGWFTEKPGRAIRRMTARGGLVLVVGLAVGAAGIFVPIGGAVILGIALVIGGLVVMGFGQAMSQRTPNGARIDAMLKAFRRTLRKELELARSMNDVIENDEVRVLADTPDKAVVWGIALGLHEEVATVLERTLVDADQGKMERSRAYYPYWLSGSSTSSGGALQAAGTGTSSGVTVSRGSGSIFSGSAVPNIGGMFAALSSVGSTPPSSSSSSSGGGGFSGGSSSGGGGASGSF